MSGTLTPPPEREPDAVANGWLDHMPPFRHQVPSERFPAEPGRYALYVNYACPWAHQAILAHALKGLQDIVQLVEADARDQTHGWWFSGTRGPSSDPITGVRWMKELYLMRDPEYDGRITIPLLWDKQQSIIVNNDSSEVLRILLSAFDANLPPFRREANKGTSALIPPHLATEIDALNAWVFTSINNGVYKAGLSKSQSEYNAHAMRLFQGFDRLEAHLADQHAHGHPFLFHDHVTEADIRLYTTLIRFDVVYYPLFRCNLKMLRMDYPLLHTWLRRLYWSEGPETWGGVFKRTTAFDAIKNVYAAVAAGNGIVPLGPMPNIMPL